MIPNLAILIWAYCVARLLQVPAEVGDDNLGRFRWVIICTAVGIVVATVGLLGVITAAATVPQAIH